MPLPQAFLDELRARVTLSALIGRTVKLTRAGREFKACCPFHAEKTPSFTVNDAKQFYHCFSCGAHGDAIRWLTDHAGLTFIEAVRELAGEAGLELPAPSPREAERAHRELGLREALEIAQAAFVRQLAETGAVAEYLATRALGPDEIARFGLGYARGGAGTLRGLGIGEKTGEAAGLLVRREAIGGDAVLREQLWDRITIPIHDARGRLCGFAGRVWPGRRSDKPKFVNSPEGPLFDKGRLLFNLHRASEALRQARAAGRGEQSFTESQPTGPEGRKPVLSFAEGGDRPPGPARSAQRAEEQPGGQAPGWAREILIIAEGYFDVIALDRAGFRASVAPMGTALTPRQLEMCWRLHHRPVLLFDGDAAGLNAAARAGAAALPEIGPGRELAVGLLPPGLDPDDLLREPGGAERIAQTLADAQPLHAFLFDRVAERALLDGTGSPEEIAAVWERLDELARSIAEPETRAQYLGVWRARFEGEVSARAPVPVVVESGGEPGEFPEPDSDSARRLIELVRRLIALREERRAITGDIADLMKMAAAIGFDRKAIGAALADIESDLAHGPGPREEREMLRVLYRRTLGIRGPLNEALLPQVVDARPRLAGPAAKRRAVIDAIVDGAGIGV